MYAEQELVRSIFPLRSGSNRRYWHLDYQFLHSGADHESEGVWNASTESSREAFAGCVEHRGGLFCIFPHQNIFAVLALDGLREYVESKLCSESVSIIRAGSKYVGALQEPIYEASE